ncbi:MAG TPA: PfkB family carbohydrate kinase [Pyrinomonadaceae bacterium]
MDTSFTVVGLGELIWDMLPAGRQLGGAPSNFAYVSRLLGNRAVVASRVGDDALGREAVARLARVGLETSFIQRDAAHPTGTVGVKIDTHGEAHFTVNPNSAWDYLEWTPAWQQLAARADAVCFGTMGQRELRARETIARFLGHTRAGAVRLFDVNLRHTFFTPDMLARSLEAATLVKLNNHECAEVARMLRAPARDELATARHLIRAFGISLVAVTRGDAGSLLVTADETSEHHGFHQPRVADTIGAGDAFAAALAHARLKGASLDKISAAANRLGAWLVTQCGATPPPDRQLLDTVARMLE